LSEDEDEEKKKEEEVERKMEQLSLEDVWFRRRK